MDHELAAPVCSPSRTGLITGRYQQRFNKEAGWRNALPDRATTVAEQLHSLGYATMMVGKNDFGLHLPSKSDPVEVAAIVITALILSFLATLYPAYKAASTDPVQVLRYE